LPTTSHFFLFATRLPPPPNTYTLSLHDALPISRPAEHDAPVPRFLQHHVDSLRSPDRLLVERVPPRTHDRVHRQEDLFPAPVLRSEEHTSELQSRENLVCRLLLEKKKNIKQDNR